MCYSSEELITLNTLHEVVPTWYSFHSWVDWSNADKVSCSRRKHIDAEVRTRDLCIQNRHSNHYTSCSQLKSYGHSDDYQIVMSIFVMWVRFRSSGYSHWWIIQWLHYYVVSLKKTHHTHCFSWLSWEINTSREHPHRKYSFSAMSHPWETSHKIHLFFLWTRCKIVLPRCLCTSMQSLCHW